MLSSWWQHSFILIRLYLLKARFLFRIAIAKKYFIIEKKRRSLFQSNQRESAGKIQKVQLARYRYCERVWWASKQCVNVLEKLPKESFDYLRIMRSALLQNFSVLFFSVDNSINQRILRFISYHLILIAFRKIKK